MPNIPKRPSAGMKVDKDANVTFTTNVDHVKWKMYQLCKQALWDTGVYLRKKAIVEFKQLSGLQLKGVKSPRRAYKGVKFQLKNFEDGLKIGLTHDTWYSVKQELGGSVRTQGTSKRVKKRGILRNTVYDNLDVIRQIQAQYLPELNNNNPFEATEKEEQDE